MHCTACDGGLGSLKTGEGHVRVVLCHVCAVSSCVHAIEGLGHLGCAGNAVVTSKPVDGLKSDEVLEAMKKMEKAMIDKRRRTIQLCGLWLMGASTLVCEQRQCGSD